jgi:dienelactone hydrolase
MRIRRMLVTALALAAWTLPAQAAVQGRALEYAHDGTPLEGYLAYDDAVDGQRPGVLVVHEWMGLGDYARRRADQLAGLGYAALAIDMYGKEVRPKDHTEAAQTAGVYKENRTLMRARARAGLQALLAQPMVDAERVAAIGYCFGGTTVLELARAGEALDLVASFHGALATPTPAAPAAITARVLVLHGAEDTFVPADEVKAFKDEMRKAGADWTFVGFGGAVHSFTVPSAGSDPSKGMAYHARADRRSWEMLRAALQEAFQ